MIENLIGIFPGYADQLATLVTVHRGLQSPTDSGEFFCQLLHLLSKASKLEEEEEMLYNRICHDQGKQIDNLKQEFFQIDQ